MSDLVLLCAGAASDRAPFAEPPELTGAMDLAADLRGRAFGRCFARAIVVSGQSDESAIPREAAEDASIRAIFGVPADDAVEAWSASFDGVALPAWRVAPGHVRVGHDQLVLTDPRELGLTLDEARALAAEISPLFHDVGFSLEVPDALRWYLTGNADWGLFARAQGMAVGRSIDGRLPEGARAREWRRLFTEAQIAWHAHPVNQERESRGARAVNVLWLDGCARGPLPAGRGMIVSGTPVLRGLAMAAGWGQSDLPWETLTPEALEALSRQAGHGDLVIDIGAWRDAHRAGDLEAWRSGWNAFERWLAQAGLSSGRVPEGRGRVRAIFTAERRCVELQLSGSTHWQFWRRLDAPRVILAP